MDSYLDIGTREPGWARSNYDRFGPECLTKSTSFRMDLRQVVQGQTVQFKVSQTPKRMTSVDASVDALEECVFWRVLVKHKKRM